MNKNKGCSVFHLVIQLSLIAIGVIIIVNSIVDIKQIKDIHIMIGGLVFAIVYIVALNDNKNRALKGIKKKNIVSKILFFGLIIGTFIIYLYNYNTIGFESSFLIFQWDYVLYMIGFLVPFLFFVIFVANICGIYVNKKKPLQITTILTMTAIIFYFLASLFSWSIFMKDWNWFSKMFFWIPLMVSSAAIINPFKENNQSESKTIDKRAKFFMAGTGMFKIDLGYDTKIETETGVLVSYDSGFYSLREREKFQYAFNHKDDVPSKITISGENVTHLSFGKNYFLVSLDVSKCTELTELLYEHNGLVCLDVNKNVNLTRLVCTNSKLTNLEVSSNVILTRLNCSNNNLSASALNALFDTLHSNPVTKTIDIRNNPGTNGCDRGIAEKKGWSVIYS